MMDQGGRRATTGQGPALHSPAPSPDKHRLEGACRAGHPPGSGPDPGWQCTGSERSDRLPEILLRRDPPPPGSSSARTSLCGSSPSLFLRPHDQPLHFLSSWCQLPREDQRVRHQRLASTLLRLLGQPVGPAPADLAGAAPTGSTRRLRAGKMEGRKRPREIGGQAFLLRLTEQAVCFFSLVLWRQS